MWTKSAWHWCTKVVIYFRAALRTCARIMHSGCVNDGRADRGHKKCLSLYSAPTASADKPTLPY